MKKPILLSAVLFLSINAVNATEHHSGHGGGGMGGNSSTAGSCLKPRLSTFLPAHMATAAPESEFSFRAFNVDKPEQIFVTVKNIPVEITTEFKDPYYQVRGKLPASLSATAARINIKVTAKSPHCEAENGWLIKIAEK